MEPEKLILSLQQDLKTLALETRRKHGWVKDACEEAITKIRAVQQTSSPTNCMAYITNQALYPVIQGCDTRDIKIVRLCLQSIQRLIMGGCVDAKGARSIYETVLALLQIGMEEIKVLQTVALLLTTNNVVQGDLLAKNLVLCFRLHCAKDMATSVAAGATVRQLVSQVFERLEDLKEPEDQRGNENEIKNSNELPSEVKDAYLLLQDLLLLVNGENPIWLVGISEMFRTFGLELLENILARFPFVFHKYDQFSTLLKEKVCALVIKLFSPNAKFKAHHGSEGSTDKPFYPISVRLFRIVDILINKYYMLLVTECEIFLSLLIRFLDPDKPTWQRCLALEVLHKLIASPLHLSKFCKAYDLKPHATNVCKDIVNALGAYIQSAFANPMNSLTALLNSNGTTAVSVPSSSSIANTNSMTSISPGSSGEGPSTLIGFYFRGNVVPLIQVYQPATPKPQLLEITDKPEPAAIGTCESYGVAISFACLLDFITSLAQIDRDIQEGQLEDIDVLKHLLSSCWPGLLAALNLLLEASIDDGITESICERLVDLAALSGKTGLQQCRESTVLSLCVAAFPPHYGYAILKSTIGHGESPHPISYSEMDNWRQQIVVVGTSVVPSLSIPASLQSTPVMLTKKNLLVTHSVLSLCLDSGTALFTSWLTVLTTLQHLCWVCGIVSRSPNQKQSASLNIHTGGAVAAMQGDTSNSVTNANSVELKNKVHKVPSGSTGLVGGGVMGAVVDFLKCLSGGVTRFIETTASLDDVSLHHVINALTVLSQESMEIAYSNREPSLFAVTKLLEIGLANLDRVEIYWRPLTSHLLEVCRHPHVRFREWGSEAIAYLVCSALLQGDDQEEKLSQLIFSPLCELSSIPHNEMREKQLTALTQILHAKGDTLKTTWPLSISIIGDIHDYNNEGMVRAAFQCLQLVVTDFLPVLPYGCIPHLIGTVAKFAKQQQELNVALSAIGLMWNIADFLYQNKEKILENLSPDVTVFPDFHGGKDIPQIDRLWLAIYQRLGELCVDPRPAIRKSAGQTLFANISAHASSLDKCSWDFLVWQVLLTLIENVEKSWRNASNEKVDSESSLLIHHSRNTAQKQWSETKVLVLNGVSKIFSIGKGNLLDVKDFDKAWLLYLQFIQNAAINCNSEVAVAAIKSLHESLPDKDMNCDAHGDITKRCWQTYLEIGEKSICSQTIQPHTDFISTYVSVFEILYPRIKQRLTSSDMTKLNSIFTKIHKLPPKHDAGSSEQFHLDSEQIPTEEQILRVYESVVNSVNATKLF